MLLVPKATRASFCARKFTSLVDFEQLKTPSAFGPRASRLRRKPSAARSSASCREAGRRRPSRRTRGSVRRGYARGERPFFMTSSLLRGDSIRRMFRLSLVLAAFATLAAVRQQPPAAPPAPPPSWVAVKPIDPPATPLPAEAASAGVTRFSFIAYGDTRTGAGTANDLDAPNPDHTLVMDGMLAKIRELAPTRFPVRFVLQSGDGVLRGVDGARWNVGFTPVIERLTKGANIPYFFSAGNHDVTSGPPGDPQRAIGLHNTLTAISRLIPPEGSPRRLNGYPTYAFGYGNAFFIALDSDIASDATQASWVANQIEHLDRARYHHVIAFFHHPPYSSGPHSGPSAHPVPATGA